MKLRLVLASPFYLVAVLLQLVVAGFATVAQFVAGRRLPGVMDVQREVAVSYLRGRDDQHAQYTRRA